jgi:signal transduction histidine kinase
MNPDIARARDLLQDSAMDPALRTSTARAAQQRARFEALRRRVFDEQEEGSARWRLTWMLPFQLIVVALLVVRGESHGRAAAQCIVVGVMALQFILRTRSRHPLLRKGGIFVGITGFFVLLVTTGGLASPLLIMGTMMLSAAAFTIHDPRWLKGAVFLGFLGAVLGLAFAWHTSLATVPYPLADASGITADYVAVALISTAFVMMGVYRMGCNMTRGYERAALELAERREELCSAGEDRSRALEGLAARLAHEVKNPLAAIKGLSTHMARSATDQKTAERLAIVAAEADRLQSIVDGFLSFSRGLDDLEVATVKPHEIVHELEVLLETRAEEAGVKLAVAGDPVLQLDADGPKLRQALLNLVLNAIQASPRGSTVALKVASDCEGAKITVQDDGVGMTPEVLDRIRKPYFTTKEGGTGLGVAVARGIVEQHGGRMDIRSASGKGTTVSIVLPMKAKPCMKLPNPLRDSAGGKTGEPEVAPITAGVR